MNPNRNYPDRRTFLVAGGLGFLGWPMPGEVSAAQPSRQGKAKSTILFFLCGGASHVDTWDMNADYRSPPNFQN